MNFGSGGEIQKSFGNSLGALNIISGGKVDWYDGYVVYSEGSMSSFLEKRNAAGFAHMGVVFVQDRYDKKKIAHELTHLMQQEMYFDLSYYALSYLYEGGGCISNQCSEYSDNEMEQEAYFAEWACDNGYVDVYGHEKKDITDDTWNSFKDYYEGELFPGSTVDIESLKILWENLHD